MKRADALAYIRIAGYHNDQAAFTRLYIENKVGWEAARNAYRGGQNLKAGGMRCTCSDCSKADTAKA